MTKYAAGKVGLPSRFTILITHSVLSFSAWCYLTIINSCSHSFSGTFKIRSHLCFHSFTLYIPSVAPLDHAGAFGHCQASFVYRKHWNHDYIEKSVDSLKKYTVRTWSYTTRQKKTSSYVYAQLHLMRYVERDFLENNADFKIIRYIGITFVQGSRQKVSLKLLEATSSYV